MAVVSAFRRLLGRQRRDRGAYDARDDRAAKLEAELRGFRGGSPPRNHPGDWNSGRG